MYVLGIDGGGTKTKVMITDDLGNVVGINQSGPSSIDTVPIQTTRDNIISAMQPILHDKEIEIDSIFAGIGGIGCKEQELEVEKMLKTLPYVKKNAVAMAKNDMMNAFYGGLATRPGIAIIIGTGSVAFGMDEEGRVARCGGYSFKEGDAGSAYDLGKQALNALARGLDGRFDETIFIKELKKTLQVTDFHHAVNLFETYFLDRTKTASLAKLVTKHGDLGDPYALEIIENGTNELALLIKGVNSRITLHNKEIAIIGSLGLADTVYQKKFIEKVKQIDDFTIHAYDLDPVVGACLKAMQNIKIELNETLFNNLKK